jgi:hypothetical protein
VATPTLEQLTIGLAAAAVVALLALLVCLRLTFRLRKLRAEYAILRGEGGPKDIFAIVSRALQTTRGLEQRVDAVVAAQHELAAISRYSLQKFAIVRYDAFGDMGGQLSFSAALLDEHGDGVIITSINGRTETRTYAKPIRGMTSAHNLSDEEREAIAAAVSGTGRGDTALTPSRAR